jgi:hypothetical protein
MMKYVLRWLINGLFLLVLILPYNYKHFVPYEASAGTWDASFIIDDPVFALTFFLMTVLWILIQIKMPKTLSNIILVIVMLMGGLFTGLSALYLILPIQDLQPGPGTYIGLAFFPVILVYGLLVLFKNRTSYSKNVPLDYEEGL